MCECSTNNILAIVLGTIGGVAALLIIIFVSIIIDDVKDHEYGLLLNDWEQKLYPDIYHTGRYFTGVGSHFILFPSNLVSIEYSRSAGADGPPMSVWTSSGLNVYLDVKIYYWLDIKSAKLIDFYYEFGPEWKSALRNFAYSSIMDTTVNYNSTNFISRRSELEGAFIQDLQKLFDIKTKGLVRLKHIFLIDLEFVTEFETAITNKLLESVETKINELSKNASIINQTIIRDEKLTDAKIKLSNSEIRAYEKEQLKAVQGEALKTLITADADGYRDVDNSFGFSLDNNLINFILSIEQTSFKASQKVNYNNAEISIRGQ